MKQFALGARRERARLNQRGAAIVEMAFVIALISALCLGAVYFLGKETEKNLCRGGNALGQVTGNVNEDCPISVMLRDDGTTTGVGPNGFEDLYLALSETPVRQVLLPVKDFDITGMNEVIVSTDRADSIAACYELSGGNVTCATMLGEMSAFDFPPNVVAVGYAILPDPDVRIEMAQPISITLGARENPELSQTWDIHAYRPAVPNTFAPEFEFSDKTFVAGEVGEQNVIEAMIGEFGPEDLSIEITPAEATGIFAGCAQAKGSDDALCGLLTEEPSAKEVPTQSAGIGYQVFLPKDARIAVSWPLHIEVFSTFEPETRKVWDITVSRPAGEAPAFPVMPFEDTQFPADTDAPEEVMVSLDGSYPSDMLMNISHTDEGLKACYLAPPERAGDEVRRHCSRDVGEGDIAFVVPAGALGIGLLVDVPKDVLSEYARSISFAVSSVDYPDFSQEFDIEVTRPAFVPEFEPAFAFGDVVFQEGSTEWQTHLVEMQGAFNDTLVLSMPAPEEGTALCFQSVQGGPIRCTDSGATQSGVALQSLSSVELQVPSDAYALGFSVDLGESAFVDVSRSMSFTLSHARDASLSQSYTLSASRPAMDVVFVPDTSGMQFSDEAWSEATEGWQAAQMAPIAGTFNSDLMVSLPAGVDAGGCYLMAGEDEPECSASAVAGDVNFRIPQDAVSFGVATYMPDEIYAEMDRAVSFKLRSAESLAPEHAVDFSYRVTRPAVPVRFDPSLGFRDKVFEKGVKGNHLVMVPIEGEITTGLVISMPQAEQSLRACYIKAKGEREICSNENARDGSIVFEVPRNSSKVGYLVSISQDRYADWSLPVSFNVASDVEAEEALSYDVSVLVSRTTTPVVVAPDFTFDDITFPAGATGSTTITLDLMGEFTTEISADMQMTGEKISPCIVQRDDTAPKCSERDTSEASASARGYWSPSDVENNDTLVHGVGYRVILPDNVHTPVDWPVILSLMSTYDPTVSKHFEFRVKRDPVPVVWKPDASLKLPDATFPVRASGPRDEIVPFLGEFTTDTDFTIGTTGLAIHPCYRQIVSGDVECKDSSETKSATAVISPEWEAIGYRIVLPDDLAQEVDKQVQVDLRSTENSDLYRSQSFHVYRAPAPVVFSPSVSFHDQEFTRGEVEWETNLQPLTGDLTTTLELFSDGASRLRLCARDTADSDLRCTNGNEGREQSLTVPPTAYEIGAAIYLPTDPQTEDTQTARFALRMKDFPSQSQDYSYQAHRQPLDIQFSPALSFAQLSVPEGESGWKSEMRPLGGSFSTDLEWVTTEPGDDLRLCTQETSSDPASCAPAGEGKVTISKDTYAVGYAVNVPDDVFYEYRKTVRLRLQSVDAQTVGESYSPMVVRPARAVRYPSSSLFPAQNFASGTKVDQTVMAELNGAGNTPMTLTLRQTSEDARLCIQETSDSEVTCKSAAASDGDQSYDFTPETFAIGYQVGMPQDHFEVVSYTLPLSISSRLVPEEKAEAYNVSIKRDVQQPIMPGSELFKNHAFAPGTVGQKVIMAPLPAGIDTNLALMKRRFQPDLGVCYQVNRNSTPICEGDTSTAEHEILDTDRSWYAVGYQIDLGQNVDEEISKTLSVSIRSQRVDGTDQGYTFEVSRLPMNAVMPDRTFFTDVSFPEGQTGPETVMQPLNDTSINLVLHKAAGQPGLSLCYRTTASGTLNCSGEDTDGEYSIAVSKNWHEVGYGFSLGSSKFHEVNEDFSLALTSSDGWSNRIEYNFNVSRPHTEMIMPSANLFADMSYPVDTTSTKTQWAVLSSDINTTLVLSKPGGYAGLGLCIQSTSDVSTQECLEINSDLEESIELAVGTYAVGYQVDLGDSAYGNIDRTVEFKLQSKDEATEFQDYSVHVTRPGKEIVMPAGDFFTDVDAPSETTSRWTFMKDISGFDASPKTITLTMNTEASEFLPCVTNYGSHSCSFISDTTTKGSPTIEIPASATQIGFAVYLDTNIYKTIDDALQITIASTVDSSKTVTYNIRVRREGAEITMPPPDLFQDIVLAADDIGQKSISIAPSDYFNTSATLIMEANDFPSGLCYTSTRERCYGSANGQTATQYFTKDYKGVGFFYTAGTNKYQPFEETLKMKFVSEADATRFVEYEVKITRPAAEVTLPPEDLFQDIVLAPNDTGWKSVSIAPKNYFNAAATMTMEANDFVSGLCYTSTKLRCYSSANGQMATQAVSTSYNGVGFFYDTGTNKYQPFDETLKIKFTSNEDPERFVEYEIKVTRPAVEVTLPPEDAFQDIVLQSDDTGWKSFTIDPRDYLNSDVTMIMEETDFNAGLCYYYSSLRCYESANGMTATLEIKPNHTRMGIFYDTGQNKFDSFNKTIRFKIVSNEDESKFVEYEINISREGKDVTLPPENAFQDIVLDSDDIGWKNFTIDPRDYLNSDVTMIMEETDFNAGLCSYYSSLQCAESANGKTATLKITPNHSKMGIFYDTGQNKFDSFNKTIRFKVVSNEDESRFVEYEINISREGRGVTLPPENAFQDIVLDSDDIGWKNFTIDPRDYLNSDVTMIMEETDFNAGLCYYYTMLRCSESANGKTATLKITPSYPQMGIFYDTGQNKFDSFNKTIRFKIVSNEDESRFVEYEVNISREGRGVTLPPENAFQNIELASDDTGEKYVLINPGDYLNSNVTMIMEATDFTSGLCYKSNTSMYCGDSAKGRTATRLITPGYTGMGFFYDTGSNEFDTFNKTIRFKIVSDEDESRFVDYEINISREGRGVTLPPEDAFEDIVLQSNDTGQNYTLINPGDHLNSNVTMIMEATDFTSGLCYKSGVTLYCSDSADGRTATRGIAPGHTGMGFFYDTGSNEFDTFNKTIRFKIVSDEDESRFVDYEINISREGTAVTLPPENAFQNIELASDDTGQNYAFINPGDYLNSDVTMIMEATDFTSGLCYKSNTSMYCGDSAKGRTATRVITPTHTGMGFFYDTGSNEFDTFNKTIRFKIVSNEDESLFVEYEINISREGTAVTLPPEDAFEDIVLQSNDTGQNYTLINPGDYLNSNVTMIMEATDFTSGLCYKSGVTLYCSDSADGRTATRGIAPGHTGMGFFYDTGSNEFETFNKTIRIKIVSNEDENRFVDYQINISRPAAVN